jgi:hypothetical protein
MTDHFRENKSALLVPRRITWLLAAILAVSFVSPAQAGPNKVFGSHWAWSNNFKNSAIDVTFGEGSLPRITAAFKFDRYDLYGYPACIRGWHYGWNPAGDNLFPVKVAAAAALPCKFSYSSSGTDLMGDFAYDVFLRPDDARSKPQLEVMIWGGNNSRPIGARTAEKVISAGGWTFDLWEGMNGPAGYYVYSFVPHDMAGVRNPLASGSLNVDLKPFFNWLQTNRSKGGHYADTMYLDAVEAGFEIVRGTGSVTMSATIDATKTGAVMPAH